MNRKESPLACAYFDITSPSASEGTEQAPTEDRCDPPSSSANVCVLLVDDDESILEAGKQVLQHFGYSVVTAQNGEDAVRLYQDHFPAIDVVILDLHMPGMGGDDCLRKIMVFDPTSKVIMSSGTAPPHLRRRFRRNGARYFLGKPYHITDLIGTIRSVTKSDLPRRRRRSRKTIIQNPIAQ